MARYKIYYTIITENLGDIKCLDILETPKEMEVDEIMRFLLYKEYHKAEDHVLYTKRIVAGVYSSACIQEE